MVNILNCIQIDEVKQCKGKLFIINWKILLFISLLIKFKYIYSSYCEREFRDCRLQTCYVQSPAYPGLYPRALKCRYRLHTRQPFIKLYLQNEQFAVDGQRQEKLIRSNLFHFPHSPFLFIFLIKLNFESRKALPMFFVMKHANKLLLLLLPMLLFSIDCSIISFLISTLIN